MRGLAAVLAVLAGLAGCKSLAYQCATDGECSASGAAGTCEPTGFCSFPDPSCENGRRYGEWGGSLSNTCVADDGPDAALPIDAMADAMIDAPPNAITVSFGETGTATHANVTIDAEITDGSTENQGAIDHNSVDRATTEVGLWRFDLSAIPSTATIVSARLELSTIGDANVFSSGKAQIYKLLETWDEATMTYFMRSAGTLWSTNGANAPGSRDPTPVAEFEPTSEDRYSIPLPASLIAGWVADPATNAGILVDTEAAVGHLHLGTREGAPAKAALLFVTYLP